MMLAIGGLGSGKLIDLSEEPAAYGVLVLTTKRPFRDGWA